jgi:hypothetical protein
MHYIVKNKKLDNGLIEGKYYCDLEYVCSRKRSLNLIMIEFCDHDFIICKSCLNFLVNEIDRSILNDIGEDT